MRLGGLFIAILLMVVLSVPDAWASSRVVRLWTEGKTDSLFRQSQPGGAFTAEESALASALLTADGLSAYERFHALLRNGTLEEEATALAWFHLYGYYLVSGDSVHQVEALQYLHQHSSVAAQFFSSGEIPPIPEVTAAFAIQIGAFGARENAERLATTEREKGYSVEVQSLPRGNNTLYAVWVGRFPSEDAARNFGNRTYGVENRDYRVVTR